MEGVCVEGDICLFGVWLFVFGGRFFSLGDGSWF